MSTEFEAAVAAARPREPAGGPIPGDLGQRMADVRRRAGTRRRVALWLVGAAVPFLWIDVLTNPLPNRMPSILGLALMHTAYLLLGLRSLRRDSVGHQLVGRAFLLAILGRVAGMGALMPEVLASSGLILVGLGLLGRRGLEPDDGPFRPLMFRGSLLVAILVDAAWGLMLIHTLTVSNLLRVIDEVWLDATAYWVIGWFFFRAVATLVAAWGIYRLSLVALLVPAFLTLVTLPFALDFLLSPFSLDRPLGPILFDAVTPLVLIGSVIPVLWGLIKIRREQ